MLYDDRPLYRKIDPDPNVVEGTLLFGLIAGMGLIGLLVSAIALGYGEMFYLGESLSTEAASLLSP
jgi:hypothetical protein